MTYPTLDGPRKSPASGNPAKQLVILVHGYGADGNDLIGLADYWQTLLPEAEFVSPHAHQPCAMNPFGGRQWFELTLRDPNEYWRGVTEAGPIFNHFIDSELERLGLENTSLGLVGFSQGTMMSLHCGLRRDIAPACIVGYSGLLAGPEDLNKTITSKPPVLLVHGSADEVIPVQALDIAKDALTQNDVSVETHISNGVGHGIDQKGLELGGAFLQKAFGL